MHLPIRIFRQFANDERLKIIEGEHLSNDSSLPFYHIRSSVNTINRFH